MKSYTGLPVFDVNKYYTSTLELYATSIPCVVRDKINATAAVRSRCVTTTTRNNYYCANSILLNLIFLYLSITPCIYFIFNYFKIVIVVGILLSIILYAILYVNTRITYTYTDTFII